MSSIIEHIEKTVQKNLEVYKKKLKGFHYIVTGSGRFRNRVQSTAITLGYTGSGHMIRGLFFEALHFSGYILILLYFNMVAADFTCSTYIPPPIEIVNGTVANLSNITLRW